MDGRANPLMDRKVVVIFGVVAVVTSPTTAGCMRCRKTQCNGSCSIVDVVEVVML